MKGDGSIKPYKGQRNVWRVTISTGKDPLTGRYGKIQRVVHGSKADARKERDRIQRELEAGLDARGGETPFADFAAAWYRTREESGEVGATRLAGVRGKLRIMSAYIGKAPLKSITPQMVESLYRTIREERGIGGTTAHMYHQVLKQCLQKAVDFDLIARNPCDRVTAPSPNKPDRHALTPSEAHRLLARLNEEEERARRERAGMEERREERGEESDRVKLLGFGNLGYVCAARLALATGMRRGEVFGLAWKGVDLGKAPCIHVTQALTSTGELKAPKSAAGVRTISIDPATAQYLAEWHRYQAGELARMGLRLSDETPVCCSATGGYVALTNFERWWRRFRKASGFEGLRFHELRHTQATQLLANGVDVKTVQHRLGHSTASLTLDQYAHALPANDRKAANLFAEVIEGGGHKCEIIQFAATA